jgi:hypothetical protein
MEPSANSITPPPKRLAPKRGEVMDDIKTTAGEIFSYEDSATVAYLIYRRFGRDFVVAHAAWMRLFQDNCSMQQFKEMVNSIWPIRDEG